MGENPPADFSPNRKKPSTPLRVGYGLEKKRKVAGGAVFSDLVKKGDKPPLIMGGGFSPNRQVSSSSLLLLSRAKRVRGSSVTLRGGVKPGVVSSIELGTPGDN